MQTSANPTELGARAEAIFREKIKPLIAPSDSKEYVLIDVDSGAFEMGTDDIVLEERLLTAHPAETMVLLRVYGGPTGQFGWSKDL